MLFSAVVDPEAFSSKGISDKKGRQSALGFIAAIIQNGTLLSLPDDKTSGVIAESIDHASSLELKLGQRVVIGLTELKVASKNCTAKAIKKPGIATGGGSKSAKSLRGLAKAMSADLVICVDEKDRNSLKDLENHTEAEVSELKDYLFTDIAVGRLEFVFPEEKFDQSNTKKCLRLFLRYAREVRIHDKMVGLQLTERNKPATIRERNTKATLRGIAKLVKIWKEDSPHRGNLKRGLRVTLITQVPIGKVGVEQEEDITETFVRNGISSLFKSVSEEENLKPLIGAHEGGDRDDKFDCSFHMELTASTPEINKLKGVDKQMTHPRLVDVILEEEAKSGRCILVDPGIDALGKVLNGEEQFLLLSAPSGANSKAIKNIREQSRERL